MASISDIVALKRLEDKGLAGFQKFTPIRNQSLCKKCGRDRVFLFTNKDKMIISPADGNLPAVLGECEIVGDEIPEPLEEWLMCYAEEVQAFQDGIAKAPTNNSSGKQSIPALVECNWNQGSPYNLNTRFINLNSTSNKPVACYVGCSAAAIGQIIYYWGVQGVDGVKHQGGCTKLKGYSSDYKNFKCDVDAYSSIAKFDFSNMTPSVPTTTTSKNAVATLLGYAARSISSEFSPNGTAAYLSYVGSALQNNFRFNAQYASSNIAELIYESLLNKWPVIMSGQGTGGHCFICDGYDASTDMYHFNFGWNGEGNGYFSLSAITPVERGNQHNYSNDKRCLYNIHPAYVLGDTNGDDKVNVSDIMKVVNDILAGKTVVGAKTNPADPRCDVNFDGIVDKKDIDAITKIILNR